MKYQWHEKLPPRGYGTRYTSSSNIYANYKILCATVWVTLISQYDYIHLFFFCFVQHTISFSACNCLFIADRRESLIRGHYTGHFIADRRESISRSCNCLHRVEEVWRVVTYLGDENSAIPHAREYISIGLQLHSSRGGGMTCCITYLYNRNAGSC